MSRRFHLEFDEGDLEGLDPRAREAVWSLIQQSRQEHRVSAQRLSGRGEGPGAPGLKVIRQSAPKDQAEKAASQAEGRGLDSVPIDVPGRRSGPSQR